MSDTQTSTVTVSLSRTRRRALSLSLLGGQSSALLHDLPAEITIHILEFALLYGRPRDLALISQIIRQLVNIIIYRTVILDNAHTIALFHRTASSRHSSHLLTHVRRLAVTWEPEYFMPNTDQQLRHIVAHCPSLRKVALPSSCQIDISPFDFLSLNDGPSDLTIQSFDDLSGFDPLSSDNTPVLLPAYFSTSLTHLRICEPGNTWQSPSTIIASLHDAPNLTHLQLARRTDSNEDNDVVFADDIAHLLATRKHLKMVVISIFGGLMRTSSEAIQESNIWMLALKLQELDPRVVVIEGELGTWREEWKDVKGIRCGGSPMNFWRMVELDLESDGA
ncbi:hypothetical protein NP233_g4506 [Leucocoprinus birnbaumii]|uniref:F-box domain-containing protein n=1 Tax=Leucocoprinus birnbaumii TaxID=56174 RepID=A0AAD5VX44_9AGAR|nr:hypothetical protein NP233_g4506 [Leucocoprinus birnbaumii]